MFDLGNLLTLSTFGESHGAAYGGVITHFPAGITLDLEAVQQQLNRRRPGQSAIVTQRREPDTVEWLSGIFEGVSTGTPLGFIIRNENQKSGDYSHLAETFRPSHADYTYTKKYGLRDYRMFPPLAIFSVKNRIRNWICPKQMIMMCAVPILKLPKK